MKIRTAGLFSAILIGFGMGLSAHATTKRYLVKFKSQATFQALSAQVANAKSNSLRDQLTRVSASVRLFNTDAKITNALNGIQMMVIQTDDAKAVATLRSHPAIAYVEPEIIHPAPKPIATLGSEDASASSPTPSNIVTPWGIKAVKAPEAWAVTKGQSARVMILDTGIDKGHAALASRFEAGQNFTDEGAADDVTDVVGHGTHVAGTILADGINGGLVGVAPEAKVLSGKVCTTQGCSSIAIAEGLNWAVQEHVDVVNMSLGGAFLSQGEADALKAAEDAGVFIAAASGNDGTSTVSYPAAVDTVMAVGAVDSNLKKADFSQYGPELDIVAPGVDVYSSVPRGTGRASVTQINLDGKSLSTVNSLPLQGSPALTASENELVDCGLGKPEDFKGSAVHGKFALIARGDIAFKDKVTNAIQNGAAGVLIYNNAPGLIQGTISEDGSEVSIPVVMIEQTVGQSAQKALAAGQTVKATIDVQKTNYAVYQGTSMATPHVAGVAALVRAANKSLTPAEVRDILKSTATPLGPNDQNQYGAGLINAEAAVQKAISMKSAVLQVAN